MHGTAGTNGGAEPLIPGGSDDNPFDSAPAAAAADVPAEECEAVREWRREFAKGLEDKAAAERKYKGERAEQARKTLTSLHNTWTKKASDTRDANRDAEKEFLRDRDALLARMSKQGDAPAWGVIPELVDMSGKFKEGARDTSRMRQVLMKMKTY